MRFKSGDSLGNLKTHTEKLMIIWNGWGILSIIFAVIGMVVGGAVSSAAGALAGGIVGGGVAALLNHLVAKSMGKGKVMIDPETNQQVLLKKSNSLFFIPMSWFTVIFAIGGILIGFVGMNEGEADAQMTKDFPGKPVFEEANDMIDRRHDAKAGNGNTPEAEEAAQAFGTFFKEIQSVSFSGGAEKYEDREFFTYCRQDENGVTFICQVPGMRKYKDDEAKKALSDIAWIAASKVARGMPGVDENTELTVGLRGLVIYGSIQQGKINDENPVEDNEMKILYKVFDPASLTAEKTTEEELVPN